MTRPKKEDYKELLTVNDRMKKYIDDMDKYCAYVEDNQIHLENRINNLLDTCRMLRNIISDLNNELAKYTQDVE